MPFEIKVSPNYTGQTDPNCDYKWCWYVWDPADHTNYVEADLVRETIGTSPDVTALLVDTTAPSVATTYNVQLIVKENTTVATIVCSSAIQTTVVQPTICDGVCVCTEGDTRACGLNNNGIETCSSGNWGNCVDPDVCTNGAVQNGTTVCGLNNEGVYTQLCTNGQWVDTTTCTGTDVCTNGATQACGNNGTQTCANGAWGSCEGEGVPGCTQSWADNYDSNATEDDGSCTRAGCTSSSAINYDPLATTDDGSCIDGNTALFHFETDLTESCGSSVSGSGAVNVTYTTGNTGFGNAATFNGTDSLFLINTSDMTATTTNILNWDGEFTVDFWVNLNSVAANHMFIGSYAGGADPQYTNNRFDVAFLGNGSAVGMPDGWLVILGPPAGSIFVSIADTLSDNTWYHVAITRDSNNKVRFFRDGTGLDMVENSVTYASADGFLHTNTINPNDNDTTNGVGYEIGGGAVAGAFAPVNGQIDELRIVKGVAEWCSNFTAPTAPHTCTLPTSDSACGGGGGGGGANPSSEDSGGTTTGTYAISDGGTDYYYWHLEDISKRAVGLTAPQTHSDYHAWNYLYDGEEVDLYVIDSGVNSLHPMLQAHTGGTRVQSVPGYAGMDNGSGSYTNEPPTNTSVTSGERGHGTYCALFAGGGVHGMDDAIAHYGPGVAKKLNIWSLRVMSESGAMWSSDILSAINAVVAHNTVGNANYKGTTRASIINFSIGMATPNSSDPTVYENVQGLRNNSADAVEDALKQAAFGNSGTNATPINVVISAGNGFDDGTSEWHGPMEARYNYGRTSQAYPTFDGTGSATFATSDANNDPGQGLTISSGATKQANKQNNKELEAAWFTNYGSAVTIFGPGEGLVCPNWDWVPGNPGGPDIGAFQTGLNGTSFSAPITAGLIALRLGAKPTEDSTATKTWLTDSTAGGGNADQIEGPGSTSNGLMKPIDAPGISGGNGPLKFAYSSSDVTLVTGAHTLQVNDKIQINGVAETPTSGSAGSIWPSGVSANQINGWHTVTAIGSDNVIFQVTGLNPTSNGGDVGGASVQYAKLTGTHEVDDGVMDHGTTLQLIPDSGSNVDIKYAPVTYSNNLYLYNPYQTYTTAWSSVPTLTAVTENDVVNLTLTALMTITNSIPGGAPMGSSALNETPFPCTMTFDSGTVPTGLSYNATTGVLSGTVTTAGTYTFTIAATNGYWNAQRQFSMTVGSSGPSAATMLFHFDAYQTGGMAGYLLDSSGNDFEGYSWSGESLGTTFLLEEAPSHFPSGSHSHSHGFGGNDGEFFRIVYPAAQALDGDFTIDFWIKFEDITGGSWSNDYQYIFDREVHDDSNGDWGPYLKMRLDNAGDFKFEQCWWDGSSWTCNEVNLSTPFQNDTWHHVAFVRSVGNITDDHMLFIDGADSGEDFSGWDNSIAYDWGASNDAHDTELGALRFGNAGDGFGASFDHFFKGYIDEIRIVRGSAEWTEDFSSTFSGNEPGPYDPVCNDGAGARCNYVDGSNETIHGWGNRDCSGGTWGSCNRTSGVLFHFDDEQSTGVPIDSGPHDLNAYTDQTGNGTPTSYLNTSAGSSPSHFNNESSYYFDGSNDFLNIEYPSALVLDDSWTIDFWVKFDDVTSAHSDNGEYQVLIDRETSDDSNNTYFPYIRLAYTYGSGTPIWDIVAGEYDNTGGVDAPASIQNDTWYHLALTYDSNGSSGVQFFVNGELIVFSGGASLDSYNFDWGASNDSTSTGISTIRIGDGSEGDSYRGKFKGYIDEFRIFKGEAKWTADFTSGFDANPPCTYNNYDGDDSGECSGGYVGAPSGSANVILLSFDNEDVAQTGVADVTTSLEGGWTPTYDNGAIGSGKSIFIDHNVWDKYIKIAANDTSACANNPLCLDGEFTIDFWMKEDFGEGSDSEDGYVFQRGVNDTAGMELRFWPQGDYYSDTSGVFLFFFSTGIGNEFLYMGNMDGYYGPYYFTNMDEDLGFEDSNWHHVAITRDSNNDIRFFIDGVSQLMSEKGMTAARTFSKSGTFDMSDMRIGTQMDDMHIDDFRIVKGVAEWCSNFTPPSSPHDSEEPSGC